ncbi:putative LRR receptor-like serine/threonine-protein kinase [Iris pallida]|uniref:LRR receptor-like serine/threonine-protein kinase n=1 Tax=Iris pallida TaxID=29817 RepID=A0AAX6F0Q4_IRIPA|nr:putative LRR receptor-like serine/threonine-protein kinase [Iris pallida]
METMEFLPLLLLLLLAIAAAAAQNRPAAGPLSSVSDLAGLYSLRASLGLRARNWPRKADPCSTWTGVSCRSGRVVGLALTGLRRTRLGRLRPRFAVDGIRNLTRLETFDSSGFPLPGPVPAWLGAGGNASSFSSLLLRSADVNGSVPDSLWSASNLRFLDLSANSLTGTLPAAAPANAGAGGGAMNLSGNLYYGSVSPGFGRFLLARFGSVDLSSNYFQGLVPPETAAENVNLGLNCFRNVLNQRTEADCRAFYSAKGIEYDGPTAPPSPPPPPPPLEKRESKSKRKYVLIGAIVGGVAVFLLLLGVIVLCVRRRGGRKDESRDTASPNVPPSGVAPTGSPSGATPSGALSVSLSAVGDSFAYDQLVRATAEFSSKNLIKHGHSGDLYHGVLEGGAPVVVKRVDVDVARKAGYVVELDFFAKASHVRLVPFLGHCLEKEKEKLIVYKYMPHGDLSNALYVKSAAQDEEEGLQSLDWITRLKIAIGVAEALNFLHHECTPPFVHRDVQASSILLDDKFEVRLGSLSEVCTQEGEGHQNVISRFLRLSSQTSEQSAPGSPSATCAYDVYCLGKVLLELVTGKLGISGSTDASTAEWLERTLPYISIYEKELVTKIVDPSLIVDEDLLEEVWAMAIVARSCLNPKPSKRPLVRYILKALENPLKVVREENSGSARLRAGSSRGGSWNAAFFGSWRHSSSDIGTSVSGGPTTREERSFKRSSTTKSQGSGGGEQSFGRRRPSKDIFPEPSDGRDVED